MQTQKLKTAADQNDARFRNLGNSNGCAVSGRCPVRVRKSLDQKLCANHNKLKLFRKFRPLSKMSCKITV